MFLSPNPCGRLKMHPNRVPFERLSVFDRPLSANRLAELAALCAFAVLVLSRPNKVRTGHSHELTDSRAQLASFPPSGAKALSFLSLFRHATHLGGFPESCPFTGLMTHRIVRGGVKQEPREQGNEGTRRKGSGNRDEGLRGWTSYGLLESERA